jgi:hypothetical protein
MGDDGWALRLSPTSNLHPSSVIRHPSSIIPLLEVNLAAAVLASWFVPAISSRGDLIIEPLPNRETKGNVHQRREDPQPRQPAREITKGCGTAVLPTLRIDNKHLGHQLVMRQVRRVPAHFRVVERQECQSVFTIPTMQPIDLLGAKLTVAVVNHDIFAREFYGTR